jgi:hypothetical protein
VAVSSVGRWLCRCRCGGSNTTQKATRKVATFKKVFTPEELAAEKRKETAIGKAVNEADRSEDLVTEA